MKVLFDANVLLSFVTGRNAAQSRQAEALFTAARRRELVLLLHQHVASEAAFVLMRRLERPASEVRDLLTDLVAFSGCETVDALDWDRLLDLWPASLADFGDALLAAALPAVRADSIATFDRAFNRRLRTLGLPTYWN